MNNGELVRKWRSQFNGDKLSLPERKTPYIIGDIEPYISPVSEKLISSRSQHREDLERTGCRVYEGREQEQKEADKWREEQDQKMEKSLDKGIEETYYGLRDGTVEPAGEKIPWTFGE